MQIQQTIVDFQVQNPNFTKSIYTVCITLLIYVLKRGIFKRVIKKIINNTKTRLDNELYPLFDRLLSILIIIVGCFILLKDFGVNVKALLGTIGASSILILYSCKNVLTNIVAGLSILGDRSFRIGDIIEIDGQKVQVLDIGSRRSWFKDVENKRVIIVPNSKLSNSKIINYTYAEELEDE